MSINRSQLKSNAKSLMRTSNPSPLIAAIFYVLVVYILTNLSNRLTGIQIDMDSYMNAVQNMDGAFFTDLINDYNPSTFAVILDIIIRILRLIVMAGFIIFTLNTLRKSETVSYYNLLDGFAHAGKIIVLYILMSIFIVLWGLLLIIPGIIAFYKYRLAIYLLIDNPDKSPMECLQKSKQMMEGHKNELFALDLSFIGWYILEIIPFVSIYVKPYTALTYTGFYEQLKLSNEPVTVYDNVINM